MPSFESFKNPFLAPLARSTSEQAPDKRQLLGVEWEKRRIQSRSAQFPRGVRISEQDLNEFQRARESHRAMKGSEEPVWAERILLEGCDSVGVTKPRGQSYRWFGEHVLAYPPHKIDDILGRTDVILMFLDQDPDQEISEAYPVTLDVTTNREKYDEKRLADFALLNPRTKRHRRSVYWADTKAARPGLNIEAPEEGLIERVSASVYLPSELIAEYRNERTSAKRADRIMYDLGPFIVKQVASELTDQARAILEVKTGWRSEGLHVTQEEILHRLQAYGGSEQDPGARRLARILAGALPTMWEAEQKQGSIDPELYRRLPLVVQEAETVPTESEEAA